MSSFDPQDIAQWTGGTWVKGLPVSIGGFCFDARQLEAGQCFVALSGGARDGHTFLAQAMEKGAAAAIVEVPGPLELPQLQVPDSLRALGAIGAARRQRFSGAIVGVTGSCGKTSTKEMLRVLLGEHGTHATEGNWNNRIGVPMTLFGLDANQHRFGVIEAGINQPGEMELLGQMIRADLNVLTNIGPAHLELLGSLDRVAAEKSYLLQHATPGSCIVLPAEVLRYEAYAKFAERAIVLLPEGEPVPLLSTRSLVSYRLTRTDEGNRHQLSMGDVSYTIHSSSRGIASNAALAIAAAQHLGIRDADIRQRIESWRPSDSRGRIEKWGQQTFYIDCYNANPASMADALEAFRQSTAEAQAHLYILGGMNELGAATESEHEAIGRRLELRPQDRVALIGPEALTQAYRRGALAAGVNAAQLMSAESIEKIQSTVAQFEGAIFLKGSRTYQLEQVLPVGIHR